MFELAAKRRMCNILVFRKISQPTKQYTQSLHYAVYQFVQHRRK